MPRSWIPLAHDWRFLRADAPDARDPAFDDAHWSVVSVPHTFNATDTCVHQRFYYRGPAWYRLRLPDVPAGRHVELVALGAFQVAQGWLNGEALGGYIDGYTGFCIDLTPHLRAGENVLALRVTNEHDPEILPGKDIPDYNLYGGIYREIGLRVTEPLRIDHRGVALSTPRVTADSGEVELRVRIRNSRSASANARVSAIVTGPNGSVVSRAGAAVVIPADGDDTIAVPVPPVANPVLWSPDDPNLYRVAVTLSDEAGAVDADALDFGFRWFRFDKDRGFFLNDQPLKLRGFNRHQDMPGVGSAIPASMQDLDVKLIRDMGGNFVRCSHYPMHPAFLDACDRLGVLAYEEIASWQHIGGERFAINAVAMMEQMIARDRHHPSIILWGLLNEGRDAALFRRLNETAHRCDPTRLTTYAENHPEKGVELGTVTIPDVLGLNYRTEDLDEVRAHIPDLAVLSSEHSNPDFGPRGALDKELLAMFCVMHNLDEYDKREWIAGSALWCMHDYGTALDVTWPLHFSGCVDGWRYPKLAAIAIKARWNPEPLVHIVGHWNHSPAAPGETNFEGHLRRVIGEIHRTGPGHPEADGWYGDPDRHAPVVPVMVISNQSPVELFLNGRSLGKRTREGGLIWKVPFEPGVLKAVAQTLQGEVAHELRTYDNPEGRGSVGLEVMHDTLPANGTDLTLITATVLDPNGVPVLTSSRAISFRATLDGEEGGAEILGLGGFPGLVTQAGVGRVALRVGRKPGRLRIVADGVALRPGEVEITLAPA